MIIKSKSREIRSVNSPNTSYLQVQEIQIHKSIETVAHIQEASENRDKKCCEC